ncbi:MAG TPA: tetratricopeptide repeat protein [Thermodesulfovibrionales bacterium]|nr:tetratricopeptide repeat protein [Thermodesulfovibrionales bacterium]
MNRTFRDSAVVLMVAWLIASIPLFTGCKKAQPPQPSSSAQTTKGSDGQTAQPSVQEEARLKLREGIEHTKAGEPDKAVREFTEALRKYPNYADAYIGRAGAFALQKKFNEAGEDLKKALEISPDNPIVHYNFAALYSLQNQSDRALESLDRALDLGFKDYAFLLKDPDLNNVRAHKDFIKILQKHKVPIPK